MSDLNFSINGKSITPTKYTGQARQFTLTIDEPEELGGHDDAANPVEFVIAGLAGCLNVVINVVAKEMEIAITDLHINIDGDLNPAKFLGLDDSERAGYKFFNVNIEIESKASKDKIDELFETVKERCPVTDNLLNATPFNFKVNHK